MKTFFSEYSSNYQTYTFGYTQYAILESYNELDSAYNQGFLPYSAKPTLDDDIFYRCRSLRVDLASRSLNSENRRVVRKATEHNISKKLRHKSEFDYIHPDFTQFCLNYAHTRYGADNMSPERFDYIMSRSYAQYIMEYTSNGNTIGYVYIVRGSNMIHYRFSYYDLSWINKLPLGVYMMTDIIMWAHEQGLNYVYLGTCYKQSGLYKVRNFTALQRRDANQRSTDINLLKELCHHDTDLKTQDRRKDQIA